METAVREYDAKLDSKNRITIREANYEKKGKVSPAIDLSEFME